MEAAVQPRFGLSLGALACSIAVGSGPSALTTRLITQFDEVGCSAGIVADTTWAVPRTG